jgi:acyl-CoA synthetase (AMP-forming)/AMP-acid ligase II/acyl carrier protein
MSMQLCEFGRKDFKAFPSIVEVLRFWALEQPNKVVFSFLSESETVDTTLTFRELDLLAKSIAAKLQSMELQGKRAVLVFPPGLDFIIAFWGCLYAGVIAVPVYPPRSKYSHVGFQKILSDADVSIVLSDSHLLLDIQSARFGKSPRNIQWIATDNISKSLSSQWKEPQLVNDSLAFLQYTSGSTGNPKGVKISHGNLLHNSSHIQRNFETNESTIVVSWLPLYHDMGLIGGMLQPVYVGGTMILMPPTDFLRSPFRWLDAISRYRATTSGGPTFSYENCIQRVSLEQRQTLDLSCWELAFVGAEHVRAEIIEQFAAEFAPCGFRKEAFYPCYGMAESTLLMSGGKKSELPVLQSVHREVLRNNLVLKVPRDHDHAQIMVGSGKCLPDQHIAIMNPETLNPCSINEVGEIWVAGNSITDGYWQSPIRSELAEQNFFASSVHLIESIYLRTGDLGYLDESGELFITGRLKELIILRGRNYYPQDIEYSASQCHKAIQSVGAAFTIDVNENEELVIVHEIKRTLMRNLNVKEVIDMVRRVVAVNHGLKVYAIMLLKPGKIPKTSSGKIQRHICKTMYMEGSFTDVIHFWKLDETLSQSEEQFYSSNSEAERLLAQQALLKEQLYNLPPQEQRPLIELFLLTQVAEALKVDIVQINVQQSLIDIGIDSLSATEIIHRLNMLTRVEIPISHLMEGMSITELSNSICEQVVANLLSEENIQTVNRIKAVPREERRKALSRSS